MLQRDFGIKGHPCVRETTARPRYLCSLRPIGSTWSSRLVLIKLLLSKKYEHQKSHQAFLLFTDSAGDVICRRNSAERAKHRRQWILLSGQSATRSCRSSRYRHGYSIGLSREFEPTAGKISGGDAVGNRGPQLGASQHDLLSASATEKFSILEAEIVGL